MTGPRFPGDPGRDIPAVTRRLVFKRDANACQYCGALTDLSIDHVWPWVQGGSHEPHNLVTCCMPCNALAGPRVFTEFAEKHRWITTRREHVGPEGLDRLRAALLAGDHAAARAMTEEP